jgi:3-oxoacyl-[acyl-carrier-protein] synthase-3
MSDCYVGNLSYALGDEISSVEEAGSKGRLLSKPSVLKDAGFKQHHTCTASTSAYDLAHKVLTQLGDALTSDEQPIGAIVYATCLPLNGTITDDSQFKVSRDVKHLMDFPASHVQADFNLNDALVIGLNQQACTAMLGSLRIAKMLLSTEPDIKQVLCITADRFPPGALYEQSYTLVSDGAAACLVSRQPQAFKIITCHGITNGAMAQASDDETVGSYFSYAHRVILETLHKANLDISDINYVVPQNMNIKAWQILSRLLKLDFERVCFPTLPDVGHVISGDNIINLKHLQDSGQIKSGDRILLFMAGYGLNWQCVILEAT